MVRQRVAQVAWRSRCRTPFGRRLDQHYLKTKWK
jgi:hypothetical protein